MFQHTHGVQYRTAQGVSHELLMVLKGNLLIIASCVSMYAKAAPLRDSLNRDCM